VLGDSKKDILELGRLRTFCPSKAKSKFNKLHMFFTGRPKVGVPKSKDDVQKEPPDCRQLKNQG